MNKQEKKQEKILRNFILILGLIIILIAIPHFYIQSQKYFQYKDIEFKATAYGEGQDTLILYETQTLSQGIDGNPFGFRTRTKPSDFKKIYFESLEDFELMKVNGYKIKENATLHCDGDGVIAFPPLERVYEKMGADFIYDQNETCSENGYYNFFIFEYGDETRINKIGNNCYEVIVKGDDNSCEILPATEKIMVESFQKYLEINS